MPKGFVRQSIVISFLLFGLKISLCAHTLEAYGTQQILVKYGESAKKRFSSLKKLIIDGQKLSEQERLICVNNFFNQVPYQNDTVCWGSEDYWATPTEMLGIGKADCEDYAIAKFFALLEMGIPQNKLFLTYALIDNGSKNHMVLAYFKDDFSTPLILDNQALTIESETITKNYIPMYRFNLDRFVAFNQGFEHKTPINLKKLQKWENLTKRL